ncbi:hypothetical protein G6O69_00920 [Pseudenhygromyxa sp. WMMC2535]|uniref:hypothetical protein n=1 Tax=Pseudenhygromyxa sp. WMMC2535 TaxID=2712867 RepID=UPI001552A192|nr:hypothetical protein [Pseudenhygromyxa sp. WMMC2535]NVB36372.1 hypothetical protein [Pseudenhygromyxa sp. WMMC2535]
MFQEHYESHPADEAWDEPTRPPTGICFVGSFEGRTLTTLDIGGAPGWFAGELAAILGLRLGASELARHLALDWADEASEGEHWLRIGELELAELKAALEDRGQVLPASLVEASSSLILREPGVALAVARLAGQGSGAGERLLRHLRERVISEVEALSRRVRHSSPLERQIAAVARERLDFERRRWEYDALEGLCESVEREAEVDPEVVWAYRVVAAEVALDGSLWQLKPTIGHGWLSPTEIARRHLGVTPQRVGQVISLLGLRESKVHSKAVLNKAVGRDRTVVTHLYSPAAVGLIERELRSRGYRRVE